MSRKAISLASLALLAVSGSVLADLSPPKERHNWTGFYVGGFVGGGAIAKSDIDSGLPIKINPSVMGGVRLDTIGNQVGLLI